MDSQALEDSSVVGRAVLVRCIMHFLLRLHHNILAIARKTKPPDHNGDRGFGIFSLSVRSKSTEFYSHCKRVLNCLGIPLIPSKVDDRKSRFWSAVGSRCSTRVTRSSQLWSWEKMGVSSKKKYVIFDQKVSFWPIYSKKFHYLAPWVNFSANFSIDKILLSNKIF